MTTKKLIILVTKKIKFLIKIFRTLQIFDFCFTESNANNRDKFAIPKLNVSKKILFLTNVLTQFYVVFEFVTIALGICKNNKCSFKT